MIDLKAYTIRIYPLHIQGKNSQTPLFLEINNILTLFEKYLTMYHLLKLEHKKIEMVELEFQTLVFLAIFSLLPVFQTLSPFSPHFPT